MLEDSLDAHNKGDLVLKILAFLQILWMFIQLGVRLDRNLPLTQLEIFTLSFTICSIPYIMLINKPQDVQASYPIKAVRHPSAQDLVFIADTGPSLDLQWRLAQRYHEMGIFVCPGSVWCLALRSMEL
ncbi:hypothetical protein N7453_002917 [Penicillium expansum]|nr:hypothetical protein N7453_002917 [Penicillium expansum]